MFVPVYDLDVAQFRRRELLTVWVCEAGIWGKGIFGNVQSILPDPSSSANIMQICMLKQNTFNSRR